MKKRGAIGTAIFTIMGMIVIFTTFAIVLYYMQPVVKYVTLNQKVRQYSLVLETEGYLSSDEQLKMKDELIADGFTNIDFGSTTLTKGDFGSEIIMQISCDIKVKNIVSSDILPFIKFVDEPKRFSIEKHTTSKKA